MNSNIIKYHKKIIIIDHVDEFRRISQQCISPLNPPTSIFMIESLGEIPH